MSGTHDLTVAALPVALGVIGLGIKRAFERWTSGRRHEQEESRVQRTVAEIVLGYPDYHTDPPTQVEGLGARITFLTGEVAALLSDQRNLTARVDEVLHAISGPHGIAHRSERGVTTALFVALTMNQVAANEGKPEPFDIGDLLGATTAPERLADIAKGITDEGPRRTSPPTP